MNATMKFMLVVLAIYASYVVAHNDIKTKTLKKPSKLRRVCHSDFIRVHCKDSPMITTSYWYNATSNICEKKTNYFVRCAFRGNNFPSLTACEAKCQTGPAKAHDKQNIKQYKNGVCHLPYASNEGFNLNCLSQSYAAWSYDSETNTCEKFTYAGCGGNDNRFHTEQACINTCFLHNKNKRSLSKIAIHTAFNNMTKLHPVCKKQFKRHFCQESPNTTVSYWYNTLNNKCEKKHNYYLSCSNLGNNFPNKWACERKCKIN